MDALVEHARRTPERAALVEAATGRTVTYGELAPAVEAFAAVLRARPRGLVALLCRNDVPTVVGYLAALAAGQPVLLLDAGLQPELLGALGATYGVDHLLAPDAALGEALLAAPEDHRPPAGPLEPWLRSDGAAGTRTAPHPDLAVLLSTSGSTGSPKLVRLSRANVTSNARAIAEALRIGPDERAAANLPLHYSYGLSVLNSHLVAGACCVLTEESVVSPLFWQQARAHGCTSMAGVPFAYQTLARLGLARLAPPALRTFTQAGGKLADDLVARFHGEISGLGGTFVVMYGQTEATARIAILPPELLPEKIGSAGRAIPGGVLRVLREDGTAAGPGEVGELEYEGPNVMLGYAERREELAHGDQLGGRLRTGDLGYLDADGCLFVTGRLKRIAKLFGLRVSLDEVEAMTRQLVPSAAVAGDDRVIVFCEAGDPAACARWAQEVAGRLRVHHRGVEFRRVEAIPRTPNGKVDYPRLQAQTR